jgi:hypothetical protein
MQLHMLLTATLARNTRSRSPLRGAAMVNWDRLLAEAKSFFQSGLF